MLPGCQQVNYPSARSKSVPTTPLAILSMTMIKSGRWMVKTIENPFPYHSLPRYIDVYIDYAETNHRWVPAVQVICCRISSQVPGELGIV